MRTLVHDSHLVEERVVVGVARSVTVHENLLWSNLEIVDCASHDRPLRREFHGGSDWLVFW